MFDPNLKLRKIIYMNDSNLKTWQDMVRQNPDMDVDPCLYGVHHENGLFLLVAGLASGPGRLLSSLLHPPARQSHQEAAGRWYLAEQLAKLIGIAAPTK